MEMVKIYIKPRSIWYIYRHSIMGIEALSLRMFVVVVMVVNIMWAAVTVALLPQQLPSAHSPTAPQDASHRTYTEHFTVCMYVCIYIHATAHPITKNTDTLLTHYPIPEVLGEERAGLALNFDPGATSTMASTALSFSRSSLAISLPASLVTTTIGTGHPCSELPLSLSLNSNPSWWFTRTTASVAGMLESMAMKKERLSSSFSSWRRTWGEVASPELSLAQSTERRDREKGAAT